MLENTTTPRIFVAATRQNDGKTTTSVGLYACLKKQFERVGYIKPVGQRFVEINGKKIDEDTVLINHTYQPGLPLEAMSPIAVDPWFTRYYLDQGDPAELEGKVQTAFNRAAWEQDFIVIEGSGHAGVGSVFNMSNAQVAGALESKAIIVSRGGVGKPLDEVSLNLALFEKYNVEVIGVILNQVLEHKVETLYPYAERGLNRMGLNLLGIIPLKHELLKPTFNQICIELDGRWLLGAREHQRRRVGKVMIGNTTPENMDIYRIKGGLIITSGDREEFLSALVEKAAENPEWKSIAGVVLTLGFLPKDSLMEELKKLDIPILSVEMDAFQVASRINRMTVKTEPSDHDKIGIIQDLVDTHVDVSKIISEAKAD
ncbi:MAG: AAA family ATPase [Verrucomicrobiota bacterium]